MKSTEFHPVHYDAHGRLRLPLLFWLVLLLQARTWVLFVIAGASREQGTALLNLFYPDHDNFWLWLNGESVSGIGLALVVADIVALIWLLTNRRLRACFNEVKE